MSIGELHTDAFLKSLVFEPENMQHWFRGMLTIFSYKKMMSTVCKKPPTEPPLATSYEAEEKYANWMKSDRLARYCMLSTMPDETKEKYIHYDSAHEMWRAMTEEVFAECHRLYQTKKVNKIYIYFSTLNSRFKYYEYHIQIFG